MKPYLKPEVQFVQLASEESFAGAPICSIGYCFIIVGGKKVVFYTSPGSGI